MGAQILIAVQDAAYATTIDRFLAVDGHEVDRCHDAQGILRMVGRTSYDVIVLELGLGEAVNMEMNSFISQKNPQTRLILLFDLSELDRAIEGIRQGAFFYLPLSSPPSDVVLVVSKAIKSVQADSAVARLEQGAFEELVGHSPAMQRVVEMIRKIAPTDGSVLILGESGTGKEVVANTIHRLSKRQNMPFIAINCAALPEALLESEMFGHVRGAFTGAHQDKAGLFEEADGGTLFLDEIGDMSPITQAKLLRVLQSGEFRRVGDTVTKRVNVRILAATNRDLIDSVAENTFREDLYFRLNVIQIRIPPLRERREALPSLIAHFIVQGNQQYNKAISHFGDAALAFLANYPFPGNVRELESIVAHSVIMAEGPAIQVMDLPDYVLQGTDRNKALSYEEDTTLKSLSTVEAGHIRHVLEVLEWNQTTAASTLGISRSTLWRKMKEYEIDVPASR